MQEEWRRLQSKVQQQEITRQWLEEAAQRLQKLEQEQKAAESAGPMPPAPPVEAPLLQEPLEAGDMVWVSSLNQTGRIIELVDGEAEVQVGAFRTRVPVLNLEKRHLGAPPAGESGVHIQLSPRPLPSVELDLRGWRVEDALPELDKYLDDAYLASLPYARIIHGKGTGTLRKVVREALAEHPLVASFRPGELKEGGDGVTVVKLEPRTPG